MAQFFVSCALGAESELLAEMREFWFEMMDLDGQPTRAPFPEYEEFKGGIEIICEDHLGFQINFFSKIANRVLLRIARFEARFFDQFEKNLLKVEFKKYFDPGVISLKIESHKSRLNNEKSITEAAAKVFAAQGFAIGESAERLVYIRIEKDRVTVSLDTSGEHLHRRGYATYRGEAPLRETHAARMVRELAKRVTLDADLTVMDPFVGSGTLLFESLSLRQPNFQRPYAWLQFKNAPKLFKSPTWSKNYRWIQGDGPSLQAVGYDMDPKAIRNCEANLNEYRNIFRPTQITVEVQDSAQLQIKREQFRKKIWIIANPPYGLRLNDGQAKEILESLAESVDGMIVLHPVGWNFRTSKLKPQSSVDFSNQGLHLKLSVFC